MVHPPRLATALVLTVLVATGCSSGGGETAVVTTAATVPSAAASGPVVNTPAPSGPVASPSSAPSAPSSAGTAPPSAAPTTVVVDDTGVPGLDSADAFCAAWSRFGGTWQVVLAANAFGGPDAAARLEVLGAPVVGDAYDGIFAAWPSELVSERDVVADRYFGAFQRRSADALAALERAGAGEAELGELADVWVDALANRDPSNPVIEVAVPAALASVVDTAAADFGSSRSSLMEDPSMVITAATPLTDEYLATACPDQGAITGSDVVGG